MSQNQRDEEESQDLLLSNEKLENQDMDAGERKCILECETKPLSNDCFNL